MDIVTGLMIWAAEALTLSLLLWVRWFYERDRFYISWGTGFALHGIGVAMVGMRGSIPDFLSIEVANTIVLSGLGFWIAGLQQFDGRRVEPYVAIPALIWIAGMFLNPVRLDFASRVALYNGAAIVGYLIMITLLLRKKAPSTVTRRFLAFFLGIQLATSAVIAVMTVLSRAHSYESSSSASLLFFPAAFCFVAGIMAGGRLLSERAEQKLRALAVTDPLTGVLNRRGLLDEFRTLQQVENDEKTMIAFLQFDLDGFKQVNDRCGHQAGDSVLVAFSRIGQTSLRGRGHFGRMGGEEFAAILRVGDMVEAASIAEAIRMTLNRQVIDTGDHRIRVTVSAGIAFADARVANLDLLLSAADRALYTAKRSGRDRTAVDSGKDSTIVPAADRLDVQQPAAADSSANQQVAALKRIAALGNR